MDKVGNEISGYSYGEAEVGRSTVTVEQLDELKVSCGFEPEDEHYLQLAGAVLADQTKAIVITGAAASSPASHTSPGTLGRLKERRFRTISPKAICASGNGLSTPVFGPTIRTGSTTSRKSRCGIRRRRRIRWMECGRLRTCRCVTSSRSSRS